MYIGLYIYKNGAQPKLPNALRGVAYIGDDRQAAIEAVGKVLVARTGLTKYRGFVGTLDAELITPTPVFEEVKIKDV